MSRYDKITNTEVYYSLDEDYKVIHPKPMTSSLQYVYVKKFQNRFKILTTMTSCIPTLSIIP